MNKLTAIGVAKLTAPGRYGDGGGLYLNVGPAGGKSWVFRFKADGRERAMGLGAFPDVSLADARAKAAECRRLRADRQDPLDQRNAEAEHRQLAQRGQTSFRECAEAYIELHEATWKNPKHRQQWRNSLSAYVYPRIGSMSVAKVDVPAVLSVLEPIWLMRPETASRLRGRIEAVLDWAKVKKMREGENPATWKGNLVHALPAKSKVKQVKHHAALAYRDLPALMVRLAQNDKPSRLALRFLILTAARTGEVIGARWSEIDLVNGTWVIPGDRMKAGREHRVPLSEPAKNVLAKARQACRGSDYVFPGSRIAQPLSGMAMLQSLRKLRTGVTAHGFRSSFRDWAAEETSFPNEVVEMALAHTIENKVEAAYRRGDLFAKRRELMNAWAKFALPDFRGALADAC